MKLKVFKLLALKTLLCLTAFAVFTAEGKATSIVLLSDADMARTARVIVEGEVTALESRFLEKQNRIFTYVTVRVAQEYKGGLGAQTLVLREQGGQVGNRIQVVDGAPTYRVGEQVLLYLYPAPDGALHAAYLFSGKFSIERNERGVATVRRASERDLRDRVMIRHLRGPGVGPATDSLEYGQYIELLRKNIALGGDNRDDIEDDSDRPVVAVPREFSDVASVAREQVTSTLDAPSLQWSAPSITLSRNPSGSPTKDDVASLFASAFGQERNGLRLGNFVRDGGITDARGFQADGINTVSFEDPLAQIDAPVRRVGMFSITGFTAEASRLPGRPATIREADIVFCRDFRRFGSSRVWEIVLGDEFSFLVKRKSRENLIQPQQAAAPRIQFFRADFIIMPPRKINKYRSAACC